jgi:hypothetical protein
MENQTEETTVDVSALFKKASTVPTGARLKDWNPMESIPTITVKDWAPGTTLNGTFVETETITSMKFTNARKFDAQGKPQSDRHILRLADGTLMGIWSVAELGMVFGKLTAGDVIAITYVNKGVNGNGMAQHFFKYKLGDKPEVQGNH